ncbi:pyruvate dehydrogenase E2 component (dihydrolipoamide acetyltransferase) [Anaerobacterium chartisolvens]|uniref:Dihydrolipoamide acetyltransferase component of pyruvate dehydrogenase complex n=1 Tax=Anaerobacterium chartisolvens TaxID=1297424 RepID=A0A369AY24_9FIRM|nr:dihydrolipoamide acetyltransferase family protein [Anaerobacterium chartisolvens]RCX12334.1 pyruvate dehydrogenase E2 component (dihydrolipoamide acetyltransferase) [Anaerobacterium chartisolvens]
MATPVIMPRQGQSVESCIIAKWYKKKGDKVQPGDILFTYETDKATFDEEAKIGGTLLELFFEEGDDVPCLVNVCVIGNEGESVDEFNPNAGQPGQEEDKKDSAEVKKEYEGEEVPDLNTGAVPNGDRELKISPRARNMAQRAGVDYRLAGGTGPQGRIIERDIVYLRENGPVLTSAARNEYMNTEGVQLPSGTGLGGRITTADLSAPAHAAAGAPVRSSEARPDYEEVKLTNIRKVIAKAMHHSISSTCQLTLNTSFDATEILAYRKKLKEGRDRLKLENITLNDIILYTVSRTILRHRDLNAHFLDDRMLYFNNVNLGVAVDTERGLMVPTVFNANLKSLNEISSEVKRIAEECQKGTVNPDLLKGGSFTITNLGTMDIESFTPVLNAPQTGILGINTIIQRAREVKGEYVYYPAMGLSLTFDHRALDGAPAARFLQDLKAGLENFSILLAK